MKQILILLLMAASPLLAHAQLKYDAQAPDFHLPVLERAKAGNYDPNNQDTHAIYTNAHTVARPDGIHMVNWLRISLWCTREATYMLQLYLSGSTLHSYRSNHRGYIKDCATGQKYYQVEGGGYPWRDGERYLVRNLGYEWLCHMEVYPPLPPTCTTVCLGDEGGTRPGDYTPEVEVSTLQANQPYMKYQKAVVVY